MKKTINLDKTTIINGLWTFSAVLSAFISPLAIVLAFILFLYTYFHYENLEKNILFCGIADIVFCASIGIMGLAMAIPGKDFEVPIIIALFYAQGIPCGLLMIAYYSIIKRKKQLCESCLMLINKEHIVSLKKISDILDIKYSKIEKTVNSLIKSKKINDAIIDKAKGEIIFEKSIWYKQHVVCENCGAELVVDFGQTLICEYCSSALRVRRIDEKL